MSESELQRETNLLASIKWLKTEYECLIRLYHAKVHSGILMDDWQTCTMAVCQIARDVMMKETP